MSPLDSGADGLAVGVAVGVVADEVGVEDVRQLGRQGSHAAVGADWGSSLVGVVFPDGHPSIFAKPADGREGVSEGTLLRCGNACLVAPPRFKAVSVGAGEMNGP